jgi:hypothetical protein
MKGILSLKILEWWIGFDLSNVEEVISVLLNIEEVADIGAAGADADVDVDEVGTVV